LISSTEQEIVRHLMMPAAPPVPPAHGRRRHDILAVVVVLQPQRFNIGDEGGGESKDAHLQFELLGELPLQSQKHVEEGEGVLAPA